MYIGEDPQDVSLGWDAIERGIASQASGFRCFQMKLGWL